MKNLDLWILEDIKERTLGKEMEPLGRNISNDLIRSVNPHNVLPDLLNARYDEAREKIEESLAERIPKSVGKSESDFEKISNCLIQSAKPEIEKILEIYMELKQQNDKIVKDELLPLLQKYITNPI